MSMTHAKNTQEAVGLQGMRPYFGTPMPDDNFLAEELFAVLGSPIVAAESISTHGFP